MGKLNKILSNIYELEFILGEFGGNQVPMVLAALSSSRYPSCWSVGWSVGQLVGGSVGRSPL